MFRRGGYHTTLIGKISHTADGRVFAYNGDGDGRDELPHAWDDKATPMGSWKRGWGIFFAYPDGRSREDGGGHLDLMDFTVAKDTDLPDGQMTQTAIETLRKSKKSDKPFFIGLGYFKPHLPFVAPKQDWDAFEGADMPLPSPNPKIDSPWWSKSGEFFKYKTPYKKTNPLSPEAHRMAKRAYYACVRYVDREVGKVMTELDRLGLADNTVVVVWGDHGWHLGEQQIWAKHTPFERANRSVLMIRAPGVSKPGLKTDALVETIDLYPTLIDLCRPAFDKAQSPLDGKSLVPVLRGKKNGVRKAALSYWGDAITVRTDTHRLITKVRKGKPTQVELYDLSNDQDSVRNLAGEDKGTVQRLLKHLPAR